MWYSSYLAGRVKGFVDRYGSDIIDAIAGTGLFFAAVVAQKALESDYGQSQLASRYNNFGGVKNFGNLPDAGIIKMDTTENVGGKKVIKSQPFATYPTAQLAFKAYVNILRDPTKKYMSMGVFTAPSPEEQIRRIAKAGYTTTSPDTYLGLMKGIIDATRDQYKFGKIGSVSV